MSVQTVTGTIEVEEMGITLPHEHMFIDLRNQFTEFDDPKKDMISKQKVNINNLGRLKLNPYAIKDNLVLDDMEIAVSETLIFKNSGGKTIVDCTSIGINREVAKLKELSLRTGVNIIAGSGYYTQDTHPKEMKNWKAENIAENMINDFVDGIDKTNIKPGIIGEIGTSKYILDQERENLIAAALTFKIFNVPVYIHTYPWGCAGVLAVDILIENGVDPCKIVLCHIDVKPDLEYIETLLKRGVYIEFDNFGKEFVIEPSERGFAGGVFIRDLERVQLISRLIRKGYANKILITNDICLKTMLCCYGGWGYAHILQNIIPLMKSEGINADAIDKIIKDNPIMVFS
jgi:phosphotriesterase-related protein